MNLRASFQIPDTQIGEFFTRHRDNAKTHKNVWEDMMQPGLPDRFRMLALKRGDTSARIGFKGQANPVKKQRLSEVEGDINSYAGKLLKKYLGDHDIEKSSVQVTPFKIKERSGKQGRGIITNGIDQAVQLADFEAWVGPGNQVLNWM